MHRAMLAAMPGARHFGQRTRIIGGVRLPARRRRRPITAVDALPLR